MWKINKDRSVTGFATPFELGWAKMPNYDPEVGKKAVNNNESE